jgi:hypothetical protein
MVAWYRVLSDKTLIREPDCVFHKSKQVLTHTKSSDSDFASDLSAAGCT